MTLVYYTHQVITYILWQGFTFSDDTFPSHPKGYHQSRDYPVLRGHNFCRYCLCSPCVIELPPDFLRGYCSPHPANDEKRHRLYRLFWALLNTLGVWRDDEYLQMKESRTSIDDRREIIPKCIITVSTKQIKWMSVCTLTGDMKTLSKLRWTAQGLHVHI